MQRRFENSGKESVMDTFNYNQIRRYLTLTFFLICFLLLCKVFGAEKILQTIKTIKVKK